MTGERVCERQKRLAIASLIAAGLTIAPGVAQPAQASPSACGTAATSSTTTSCRYTDATQEGTFTVPPQLGTVHVVADGAAGGGLGGAGAQLTADIPVASATTYYIEVGVGGGLGGTGAGAGGGAASVESCSISDSSCVDTGTASDPRIIVAGGGGGGDSFADYSGGAGGVGSNAGCAAGGDGSGGTNPDYTWAGFGGGGGGCSGGGGGGSGGYPGRGCGGGPLGAMGGNGGAGGGGSGGSGGVDAATNTAGGNGGGGGGGFWGGGGGGGGVDSTISLCPLENPGGGGGGGSSFAESGAVNVSSIPNAGAASVTISWSYPTTTTATPARSYVALGYQSNSDAATVTGNSLYGSPTGTVTFFVCGPVTSAQGCASGGTMVGNPDTPTAGAYNTATATSSGFMPNAVGTWCFRADYTSDSVYGASSDGSSTQCFTVTAPITYQDTDTSVTLNSWEGVIDSTASGGTYRASAAKGANASFKFTATGITWVTRKGPDQGIASVTIDGASRGSVDLYATSAQSFSKSYSGLSSRTHTIVVTVTGTKNAASTGTQVAVDAFVVGFTTTEDSSPKVTYGSWKGVSSASASGGTYRVSAKKGATARLILAGERVDWITATGPSAGMASVMIDGVSMGTIDLYAPTVNWQAIESFPNLAPGTHTIVVTVLGTMNPSAASTQVVVDAFVVYS